ncbi:MAG: hypothetical protein JW699_01235 [Chitinispirillaceae bacterium]|nr:hypothetical protein [Chitinispirillaceae bacterium]
MRNHLKTAMIVLLSSSALFAEYFGLFQIAEVPTTPRVAAMGGAGAAIAGGGFGVYNPASPAFADAPFLSCEFGREPGDLSRARLESSWMFPKWFAGASFQFRSAGFFVTDERTDETTMNAATAINHALLATATGGYVFGRLAAGSALNFFEERIGDQSWHAFTFSPGVLFQLVPGAVTIGASLSNYLRLDTVGSPWYATPVVWYRAARGFPRYARAGIAWSDTLRRWDLPFVAAGDFVYSDVYERSMVPIGAEVRILPSLAARAGACINHPSEIVHFGVGIYLENIRFDFDYGISRAVSDVEAKWLFGLTYSLKKNKNEAPGQGIKVKMTAPAAPEVPVPAKIGAFPEGAQDSVRVPVTEKDTTAAVPTVPSDSTRNPEPAAPPSAVVPDSLLSPTEAGDAVAP